MPSHNQEHFAARRLASPRDECWTSAAMLSNLRRMITVETVGTNRSKWGEGPIWWDNTLYYVDIESHSVHSYDPASGEEKTWQVGERVGTVVPRANGGLVIAGDNGIHLLDPATGELKAITDPEPEKENNRFNDGKCSPDGRFFAGTISLTKTKNDAALYRLDTDFSLETVFEEVTNSNGLAWSLDDSTLYYIDTPRKCVLAFDYDTSTGSISNPKPVIDTAHLDWSPDGMTIDAEGKLWIAFCHGACVRRYCPDSGSELQVVDLPVLETTALAFGGPDLADLYVTTGIHKSEVEEDAGRLFVIKGLGVKGVPAFSFGA